MRKLVVILGVPIDDLNVAETLNVLESFVRSGRATGKSHQIATVNADFVVKANADPELRLLLQEADLTMADGMPLVWGARLLGVPLHERVAGSDVIPLLAERAAQCGFSVFFLGAAPGVAETAAHKLKQQFPDLIIAGVLSPPFQSVLEMDDSIVAHVRQARPDILLVAFGNPKQEKWIGMHRHHLHVPVMIGVGATLDFIAGQRRRAPLWMQKYGLEWLFRLLQEPRRLWRRYAVDMVGFGAFFLRQWWLMRRGLGPTLLLPKTDLLLVDDVAVLNVQGRLTVDTADMLTVSARRAMETTTCLIVNLADADFLDSSAIGALVALANQVRDRRGMLLLTAVPPAIARTLMLLKLDDFFETAVDVQTALRQIGKRPFGEHAVVKTDTVANSLDWIVLEMPRRLDASTADEAAEHCIRLLQTNGKMILDFSHTVFLASAGLAMLARLQRHADAQHGQVRLANCSPDVRRVLAMVRFDKLLALYEDIPAAANGKIS